MCQREIITQTEADVTGDVMLILSDVFKARLNDFNSNCCAFPWKPSIAQHFNQQKKANKQRKSTIKFD
jgi:hypothetical protein